MLTTIHVLQSTIREKKQTILGCDWDTWIGTRVLMYFCLSFKCLFSVYLSKVLSELVSLF